jgi:hypothetical protein
MRKLYRLVGAAGMCFRAFGLTVGVRVNEPDILEPLNNHLPPGCRFDHSRPVDRLYSFYLNRGQALRGVRRFHTLYRNSAIFLRSEYENDLYDGFESDVDSYIAETSPTRFFVHAGVVGWHGRAIVIPGQSYSGKSSLVREFLRAGAAYYSDEFAVFDRNGYVHSFSRPLGIRVDGSDEQILKFASEFGSAIGTEPLRVGLVILTTYKKEASWHPSAVSPGEGTLMLLANSLSGRANPSRAFRILTQVTRGAHILRGPRGEAGEVVRMVQERFGNKYLTTGR